MAPHNPETPASHDTMLRAMQAYGAASRQLNAWIAGAQALGLLRAAQTSGILDATMTPLCWLPWSSVPTRVPPAGCAMPWKA